MTNPPVCDILKLDQRKLPAEVFERVSHRAGHLKIAQMQNHWDQVVGRENAMHTYPVSLRDGILTIRCDSPAWTTTMNYMIPELTRIIREKLEGLTITEVRVTGPQQQSFSRGRISRRTRY